MQTVTLSGTASDGTLVELPVNVTLYGPNLIEDPTPTSTTWTAQDGSLTAMPGYLYWDSSSETIGQRVNISVTAEATYELYFEGIILDGSIQAKLLNSGADPIDIDAASAFGVVGTFTPDTTGSFPLRFVDNDGLSSGRIKAFRLREVQT